MGYWKEHRNLTEFFEDLGNSRGFRFENLIYLHCRSMEDYYSLHKRDIIEFGGSGLLTHYGNSIVQAISAAFPHFTFLPWKFTHVSNQYWKDSKNQVIIIGTL